VIDIGGGSTEFIIGQGMQTLERESLQAGCIASTRRFFPGGKLSKKKWKDALTEIGAEKNTTIVFPLPIDLIGTILNNGNGAVAAPAPTPAHPVQPPRSPLTPPAPTPLSQSTEPRAANE